MKVCNAALFIEARRQQSAGKMLVKQDQDTGLIVERRRAIDLAHSQFLHAGKVFFLEVSFLKNSGVCPQMSEMSEDSHMFVWRPEAFYIPCDYLHVGSWTGGGFRSRYNDLNSACIIVRKHSIGKRDTSI